HVTLDSKTASKKARSSASPSQASAHASTTGTPTPLTPATWHSVSLHVPHSAKRTPKPSPSSSSPSCVSKSKRLKSTKETSSAVSASDEESSCSPKLATAP